MTEPNTTPIKDENGGYAKSDKAKQSSHNQADKPSEMAYLIRQSNLIEGIDDPKEDKQSLRAWNWLISRSGINDYVVRELHGLIVANQSDLHIGDKGMYRHIQVWVGGYQPPNAMRVPELMQTWCRDYYDKTPKQSHIDFEKIHPFVDGNGRTGRMLMWWHELKLGLPITPILNSNKEHYYRWFTEGNDLATEGLEPPQTPSNPPNLPDTTPTKIELDVDKVAKLMRVAEQTVGPKGFGISPSFYMAVQNLVNEAVISELESILENSSGGGNWRRQIILRVEELSQ